MNTAQISHHHRVIRHLLKIGYYADLKEGTIFTPEHQQKILKPRGKSKTTLVFRVHLYGKREDIKAAHFVAAYTYGTDLALHPYIGIRFADNDPTNLKPENLMLFRRPETVSIPLYSRRSQPVEASANSADMMGYISERRAERAALDTKRHDFFVRRATLLLIDALKSLLYSHAVEMVDFEQDEFVIEQNERWILHQLAEYLTQTSIIDEDFERMVKPHQLSKYFAATSLNLFIRHDDPDCFEIIDLEAEGDADDE